MYQPAAFTEERPEVLHDLIRAHPLGLLVSAGAAGLSADPIPFLIDPAEGEFGTLRAHLARANPHVACLHEAQECLVAFTGPQGYISPSWYAAKAEHGKVVPTWNYAAVHAWGKPRVIDDPAWLRRFLEALTHSQEQSLPAPWAVGDAPADFIAGMLRAIVGVEIPIRRIEGKFKMSQNRAMPDRIGVVEGLRARGAYSEPLAALVAERGDVPKS
ncbi:FMN-binding negative transcriptional regulator [Pandoraea nosoerga]|uniref:Transcriptional regulator n=1 Tax=Pandoraea nosoerga TaxID=2508296 RepID=A0A5E4TGS7_9BURK|nr:MULTISPECIES: FMN-binding negative transcriptional regulator [Pandoraea]MBN4665482.1 FMN-binding negative transcriptional regulator [Pandoraea nosoerga]MBN4675007.1 FMN-binding negative transcriptional regulator [Pandoraea nosoerga]MBN4680323.1 FMN-binding negative transcriptional regulator [Pandoraea nosoerga]MBN4744444.1 FMN-binding negative transcriptional regulator [Pandoraea nosoerga]VVD87220.1 transcriptional regulator [Pandoraea nosoerga]